MDSGPFLQFSAIRHRGSSQAGAASSSLNLLSIAGRGSHPAVSQPACNHASTLDEGDGWVNWSGLATQLANIEKAFTELARRYIGLVIRPEVLQLRRLVIGEAARFPDLADTYYKRVPERVLGALAAELGRLAERGLLRIHDRMLAANHFVALILWAPLDRAMFHLEPESLSAKALDKLASGGVRVFLAAYGTS